MAMSNVELYEALRGSIPDNAARMIAEAFHPARDLVTKHDLADFRTDFLKETARLESTMEQLHSSTLRWMLGLFVPIWAATWGTLLVAVLRG